MNNKNIEEQIKEILKNNRRYARYENCGHEVVDENKAVKELTNLLTQQRELAVRGLLKEQKSSLKGLAMKIKEPNKSAEIIVIIDILESLAEQYLSQQREKVED